MTELLEEELQGELRVGLSFQRHGTRADGIGVYTAALARALPNSRCKPTPCFYSSPGLVRRTAKTTSVSGSIAFPRSFHAQAAFSSLGWPLRTEGRIDVYHATDFHVVRMDCPVVATLHDAVPLKHPEWTSSRLRWLKNWQIRQAGRIADHVIAHARASIPDLVEFFGIEESKISVVPCGIDRHWLQPVETADAATVVSRFGLIPGYFLFVGTLQPRKNVARILAAYLTLPKSVRESCQLVIVGRAGWSCKSEVEAIRAAQAKGERVVWLESITGEKDLKAIYANAGVFVFPSLYEGFGIPVLEAFASGVPVITSNSSSLPEVSAGAAMEVDALSVDDLVAAMERLAEDQNSRNTCIALGRERALHLSWENTASLTAEVYRSVI
ncbi:D-inositol-3-phosphate glycosyltransferase [Cupriavidus yeoncheonensis]|uniref:D-inositol-3-phosphate glycosyltransferase n=1 Tax=Cupriavidus yeoncheonensis TaxID=1462994 RepID=A0A916IPW8_9BURK|nr:glycosyltransferase family 1 protein [Cupriavidus yeoncheonensis]CAG2128596.1 D-inositol-3-phosphate glycosyltransferase [Cupriavidus yeoncheonensis]